MAFCISMKSKVNSWQITYKKEDESGMRPKGTTYFKNFSEFALPPAYNLRLSITFQF